MPDCHILQIEHDALTAAAREAHDDPAAFHLQLGEKIHRLCLQYFDPLALQEPCYDHLGGTSATAVAWRAYTRSGRDQLLYWGGALKPLHKASERELQLAARLIQDELARRQET